MLEDALFNLEYNNNKKEVSLYGRTYLEVDL